MGVIVASGSGILPPDGWTGPDYTTTPTRLRITHSGFAGEDFPWELDAIDRRDVALIRPDGRAIYRYTEQVWTYPTHREAVESIPEFLKALLRMGIHLEEGGGDEQPVAEAGHPRDRLQDR